MRLDKRSALAAAVAELWALWIAGAGGPSRAS